MFVPCDHKLNVTPGWAPLIGATDPGDKGWLRPRGLTPPAGFNDADRLPIHLSGGPSEPRVWLVNSGGKRGDLRWLVSGLRSAVLHVVGDGGEPRHGRARRLIALPVLGVGAGGFHEQRGQVLDRMLSELTESVARVDAPDLVLVAYSRSDYAALQVRRRDRGEEIAPAAKELGQIARRRGLVLFLGAGASAGAGFPSWSQLLTELAESSSLTQEQRDHTLALPAPDAADVIWGAHSGQLGEVLAKRFTQDGCSLTHALLASLRVHEAVTTNYDTLYENAARVPFDGRLRILPRQRRESDEPWLLKLHGDVKKPESIVLTREHYLRFDADSAPLAAVVQANMVTKHMLFVGYSLSDENFIRLARQVRQLFLRTQNATGPVGTVLSLSKAPARELLWKGDLRFVALTDHVQDSDGAKRADAARRLEILLDQIALESCDEAPYLLDDTYTDLLSDADRTLADAVRAMAAAGVHSSESPGAQLVTRMLNELGWKDE